MTEPALLHEALERLFHEPNRLAIMSTLCAERAGLSFTALREACRLTDGNLNRHLKALEEAGAVRVQKKFVDGKPQTSVRLSALGLRRFAEYLEALHHVLRQAKDALATEARSVETPAVEPNRVTAR